MSAFNVVRMRVKPGRVDEYLKLEQDSDISGMAGLKRVVIVKTGERDFCFIGEWTGMDALAAARPEMIASLDQFRDMLEELGGGLGVTDPVSGEAALDRSA